MLSVLLQYTDSDYPFCIFKLSLIKRGWVFQKRVERTRLDIYVFIAITVSIPLMVDY